MSSVLFVDVFFGLVHVVGCVIFFVFEFEFESEIENGHEDVPLRLGLILVTW